MRSTGNDGKMTLRFNRDGQQFVVTDHQTVERARKLLAPPQIDLRGLRSALGAKQAEIDALQSGLASKMSQLKIQLPNVRRQLAEVDAILRRVRNIRAEDLSEVQEKLANIQEQLAAKQSPLVERQEAIAELMAELQAHRSQVLVGDESSPELENLIQEAIRKRLAKPLF